MRKVNNNLLKSLLYHVARFDTYVKKSQKEESVEALKESKKSVAKAERVWSMLGDPSVLDDGSIGGLRSAIFKVMSRKEYEQFHNYLKRISAVENKQAYWKEVDKQAGRFKRQIRQVLRSVELDSSPKKKRFNDLVKSARNELVKRKNLKDIPKSEVKRAIPKKMQTLLFNSAGELNTDRFEFWLYSRVKIEIESGNLYCKDSIDFRSLDDDLIDPILWQKNKSKYLEKAGLSELNKDFRRNHSRVSA